MTQRNYDAGHQHTNASMRKLLGEAGYIESTSPKIAAGNTQWSMWERGGDYLFLSEETSRPILLDKKENEVDPHTLGVRNPNIQNREEHNDRKA